MKVKFSKQALKFLNGLEDRKRKKYV